MDTAEYISSGILESYVLGALTSSEAKTVEANAAAYPEISAEILAIQLAMENYAFAHSIEPSERLKKDLFHSIENTSTHTSSKTVSLNPIVQNFNWLVAASVTVAILSTSSSVYFWNKWQNTESKLLAVEQENQIIAYKASQEIETSQEQLKLNAEYFSFITDTSTTRVAMKGVALSPSSIALVFWNTATNEVYLDVQRLPEAPAGMQYQLWALNNGVPIDAGVFETSTNGKLQRMKHIDGAQAFAVTLEKIGGSPTPNLEALYVLGTI